jgi:hypothetical protein
MNNMKNKNFKLKLLIKKLILLLLILNFVDYLLTLNNLNNFKEANLLMEQLLDKPFLLGIVKIIIVPCLLLFIFLKIKKPKLLYFLLLIVTNLIYSYAVILGFFIAIN